jgi:hypothetical protein
MTQYDGLIQSSQAQLEERIKADMKAGKSYGESLASILTDIKSKPEYNRYLRNKAGLENKPSSLGGNLYTHQDKNGNWVISSQQQYDDQVSPTVRDSLSKNLRNERSLNGSSVHDNIDFVNQLLNGKITNRN